MKNQQNQTRTASGYAVIDYLRCKHPEAEDTFKIDRVFEGDMEQASIVIDGHIFVSQRSSIMSPSGYDTVLFKDRSDTNRRFSVRLCTVGASSELKMDENLLKGELSSEILSLIDLFNL